MTKIHFNAPYSSFSFFPSSDLSHHNAQEANHGGRTVHTISNDTASIDPGTIIPIHFNPDVGEFNRYVVLYHCDQPIDISVAWKIGIETENFVHEKIISADATTDEGGYFEGRVRGRFIKLTLETPTTNTDPLTSYFVSLYAIK